jgi:hypothetical protein
LDATLDNFDDAELDTLFGFASSFAATPDTAKKSMMSESTTTKAQPQPPTSNDAKSGGDASCATVEIALLATVIVSTVLIGLLQEADEVAVVDQQREEVCNQYTYVKGLLHIVHIFWIVASAAHLCRADAQRDHDSLHHEASGALIQTVPLQHLVSRLQVPTAVALENESIQRRRREGMRTHGTASARGRNEKSIAENIAICFCVIPSLLCHVQKSETPSKNSIWGFVGRQS